MLFVCQNFSQNQFWHEARVCCNQCCCWADWHRVDLCTGTGWGIVSLTGAAITGAPVLRPCAQRQTLGHNGPGDRWARWVCPLNRPINLDEAQAAPSQIFPSTYFLIRQPPPPLLRPFPLYLPHILKMEKSCYNSDGRFLAMYTAERRNIYTMGDGDDSAQFVSLWQGLTSPFPSWANQAQQTCSCACAYTNYNKYKYTICKYCWCFRRS